MWPRNFSVLLSEFQWSTARPFHFCLIAFKLLSLKSIIEYLKPTRRAKKSLTVKKGGKKETAICLEDSSQLLVSWEKTLLPYEYNKTEGEYRGLLNLIL